MSDGRGTKRARTDAEPPSCDNNMALEFNVGGTLFSALRSTLTFEENSMLAKLFEENSPYGQTTGVDSEGRPFIDRDGDIFGLILGYLRRSGRLVGATSLSSDTLARLREDAEYFGLSGLVEAVDQAVSANAQRTEDEKQNTIKQRVKETKAAEERQAKRRKQEEIESRYEVTHVFYGPLVTEEDEEKETERQKSFIGSQGVLGNELKKGFRIAHAVQDGDGRYIDMVLERRVK